MFINEALIKAFESGKNKGNASKDETNAITNVIQNEIRLNTKCDEVPDARNAFIAADNMRGYIAIYISDSIGEQILCSYNVIFKYGILHYLVLPVKYDHGSIDSLKYIDCFIQKAMTASNTSQIPGIEIITQAFFSKFVLTYAGILDRHEMMFRFMKKLIMNGIDPRVAIERYRLYSSDEKMSDDEIYSLRCDCIRKIPKRKFPITMHSVNFMPSEDGDEYECEGTFEKLLDHCMGRTTFYTDNGYSFEIFAKAIVDLFMEDVHSCVLIFASHNQEKDVLGACKAAVADTSIDVRLVSDGDKKYLSMQVTPLLTADSAFESKIELTDNVKLDAYNMLNLNTFVKDWFDSENKNGIPTTMEEYQKYPMGNPQPIEIQEFINNSFVD